MKHISNNNNNSIIIQVYNIHIQTIKFNMNKIKDQSNNNYVQFQRTKQSRER